jgi:hypothetical protein
MPTIANEKISFEVTFVHISFWYISMFLYNDFMFEYYIIFSSFSLNDIYWIHVFVYI